MSNRVRVSVCLVTSAERILQWRRLSVTNACDCLSVQMSGSGGCNAHLNAYLWINESK